MTIICYRDGVLASDSLESSSGLKGGMVKKALRNRKGELGAAAGLSVDCFAFQKWFMAGRKEPLKPKHREDEDFFEGVVVQTNGRVVLMECDGIHIGKAPFYALGAGKVFAMGAMAAGASAVEAVRLTVKFHTECGGRVHSVKLGT